MLSIPGMGMHMSTMQMGTFHQSLPTPVVPPPKQPTQPEVKKIESGTVVSWDVRSGTGRILSDADDMALFVHQADLLFTGEGPRQLPLWHQCEFTRSKVNGSDVACQVSKTLRRRYNFPADPNATPTPVPAPPTTQPTPPIATKKEGEETTKKAEEVKKDPPAPQRFEKLNQYRCVVTTNESVQGGKMYYFHGQFRYGVIIPDNDTDKRIHADADAFIVGGSFLNVRKGTCVEFMTGKNKEGLEVAVSITGPDRKPITAETRVDTLVPNKAGYNNKRKLPRGGTGRGNSLLPNKRLKQAAKAKKPLIPDGKNPISIFYEFANSCNPKRIPSIKLVCQNTRTSGMVSDFTFEARLDDKPIAQGRAKTKKDAKAYAAFYALESLEKESSMYKQELDRIKKGIPSVKKQMRNFTKRKWRPAQSYTKTTTTSTQRSFSNTSSTPSTYLYQPALVVPQIAPAVSLTTYNPVSNTTSTSYMNQETAQKFAATTVEPKKVPTTYPTSYQNYTAATQATTATPYQFAPSVQNTVQTNYNTTATPQPNYPWQATTGTVPAAATPMPNTQAATAAFQQQFAQHYYQQQMKQG